MSSRFHASLRRAARVCASLLPGSSLAPAALLIGCALTPAAAQMPEQLYRDAAAEGQRDFARQLHHAANADLYIASRYIKGEEMPVVRDTAITFATRAGLKRFINATYDYSTKALREQTDADRNTLVWYFGQKLPKWLVWDELNQHTLWTAGQIVANFRKHGMAPPPFSYY
jgi:hypothetical protein